MSTKRLLIVRGLPGSGKSTTVQKTVENLPPNSYIICSNDNYPGYYVSGAYKWTPQLAKEANRYCKEIFGNALVQGVALIIVDNTNLNRKSYGYYLDAAAANGYTVECMEFRPIDSPEYIEMCAKRNKHGVCEATLRQMLRAWEDYSE